MVQGAPAHRPSMDSCRGGYTDRMNEQWKSTQGFENYEVSDQGQVRRSSTKTILKTYAQRYGYLYVKLWNGTKMTSKRLHVLVAKAFVPNPLSLPEVNHKGIKEDCRAISLEWRSKLGNNLDRLKRELSVTAEGVQFTSSKRWKARYQFDNKFVTVGTFDTKEEAIRARKAAIDAVPYVL